jgi:hypothetical protein
MLSDKNYNIKLNAKCIKELANEIIEQINTFGEIDDYTLTNHLSIINKRIYEIEREIY